MMFRAFPLMASLMVGAAAFAQRPTATLLAPDLVQLDLEGQRVLCDAPTGNNRSLALEDIALYVLEPTVVPVSTTAYTPKLQGPELEKFSAQAGERTGIYIYPHNTFVEGKEHRSYQIEWNGRRIWFSGLTADATELLKMPSVDLAFVNPAQMEALAKTGRTLDARTVVVYHISTAEELRGVNVPCDRCKVLMPAVGEKIELFR